MEPILIALTWMLGQTQILSHITKRLLDRYSPPRAGRFPQVEEPLPARRSPPAAAGAARIMDQLIVPPPGRLLFVRERPGPSRPLLAIVLADRAGGGRVRWILVQFDVPIDISLPENAIALLPLLMRIDGSGQARIEPHGYAYTGTVDGYQVYAAA
ncbi:hypothetical protein AMIS_51640 [Actinoplanes missouriensis 431]|uniref:Uncharacterized protein n=1 Tax=Actinoplanes missouriensis (strain ATCC 14538 / DSM 43046 / CBS 188.64 / JCM 3121 / NBRC 102363 / NCIMB 12654 / NRRL B-3342 / UNCC 431) TaxID=512565 RepID=I0HBJ7_ACTM4|nr:hypothetical protein [Actinoplanes missouriensis]BAL90384.1 hypothetical protein AMIS_51640 [Actinoplanes missouriensis 431]